MLKNKIKLVAFLVAISVGAMAQGGNIIRVVAPISFKEPEVAQDPYTPIVSTVSIPAIIAAADNSYPGTFKIPLSFSASNYDQLFLVSSDGSRYNVSGKSSHDVIYRRPTKGISFWLEAKKDEKVVTSAAQSASASQWCGYSYNNFFWRSISASNIRITDKYEGVNQLSSEPGNLSATANGWNYSYYAPEALKLGNDGYYGVCKSESPINNPPVGKYLAECPAYSASSNSWIDNGSSQEIRWTNGADNFSITVTQGKTFYDRGGYRYYPDPYDTGDKYYPICRNKL